MKQINKFITEYIVKKKLYKPIDSEDHYKYFPKTKEELRKNIQELLDKNIYNFNCIDTSAITDMANLFDSGYYNKKLNNIDISKWNVSNVKYMQYMFYNYEKFDCDLSKWNVSNVKDMEGMFYKCWIFAGNGLENWDVSNVTNMDTVFENCKKLNCNLSNWDVHNVTSMVSMFEDCTNFNSDLSNWNVSNVTDMSYMFYGCELFDCDLSGWDVNKVRYMDFMFDNCMKLKKIPSWY